MTRKSWLFFRSFFFPHIETLVLFLTLWPLSLYGAVHASLAGGGRARVAVWQTGSEEERQHGGSSENHHIWIQGLVHVWVILAAVLVKACVCFRYSGFSAHKAIILNVAVHYVRSQPNTTPYRHAFGETHMFFRARPRQTCFSLRCCVCVSPAITVYLYSRTDCITNHNLDYVSHWN